ncbi:MAG: 16S rRNA (cytosine(967)-C(5))-methyltransferase RsmB, partial [Chlamydiota bacterium]|nr:16S rRNA (cytosine(967)-C(5))-methyltransferase RsmB [Chlamydiota bacterium]
RKAALFVLNAYEDRGCRLKKAFQDAQHHYPGLTGADFRLAHEIAYGVVRYQLHLDWCLQELLHRSRKKLDRSLRNILRIGLYQLRFLNRIPAYAAVNGCVELARLVHQSAKSGFVNGVLRSYIRSSENIRWPDERTKFLSVYYSYPEPLVLRWLSNFGDEKTESLLERNNQRPFLGLRINPEKTDRDGLVEKLKNSGIPVTLCEKNAAIVHVQSWTHIENTQMYEEGLMQVQDESALLPVHALNLEPHLMVLDLCAAPGGKTTAMAQLMHDQGMIVACDLSAKRLRILDANKKRLDLHCIRTVAGDATNASQWLKLSFDRILVDAPCTNTGVLSRRIEARWRFDNEYLRRMVQMQHKILTEALCLLRDGGLLVYSTCSIDSAENGELVEKVISCFPNMRLIEQLSYFPDACQDGGYWAKIQRII